MDTLIVPTLFIASTALIFALIAFGKSRANRGSIDAHRSAVLNLMKK